ncbi:MAG: hypothetical protein O7H39_02055 [Gammaproteobacteria bacterium]|nr:hypothetical protein [Gammaproteobacteria bacterium]
MFRSRQTGLGLVGALFLIVTVAVLVVGIARLVRMSADAFALDVLSQKAMRAAESGASLGLNRIFAPAGTPNCGVWRWSFTEAGLENCTAEVSCTVESTAGETLYNVLSHGACGSAPDLAMRGLLVRSQLAAGGRERHGTGDEDPSANIANGRFRGHDRIVYWHDVR